ncbi:MAG: dihydroneopterin aldolase [Bacteroidota bacterium]
MIVALHGAEFFAYHGFYPEEQKLGTCFTVDIEVEFKPDNLSQDDLVNTVDYEKLYNIICEIMKVPKKLIETVAQTIIDEVKQQYNFVDAITVTLKKNNPPMGGKVAYSAVSLNYQKG